MIAYKDYASIELLQTGKENLARPADTLLRYYGKMGLTGPSPVVKMVIVEPVLF